MGNHRAHKIHITSFTGGHENGKQSRGKHQNDLGTVKLQPTAGLTGQSAARGWQQVNADTLGSLLAGNPSLPPAMDTKSTGEGNGRKAINESMLYVRLGFIAL